MLGPFAALIKQSLNSVNRKRRKPSGGQTDKSINAEPTKAAKKAHTEEEPVVTIHSHPVVPFPISQTQASNIHNTAVTPNHPLLIGDWIVLETIAEGGCGVIQRVQHCFTNQIAVIKTIKPNQESRRAAKSLSYSHRQELKFYKSLSRLNYPRWAPKLLDHGILPDVDELYDAWFALEYLGPDLFDALPLDTTERSMYIEPHLRSILSGMLSAVEALHNHGYIHRDIKPENFVLRKVSSTTNRPPFIQQDEKVEVVLIDYGFALPMRKAETASGGFFGTACYASENALEYGNPTACDDIESLAYSFIEIVSGERAYWDELFAMKDVEIFLTPEQEYDVDNEVFEEYGSESGSDSEDEVKATLRRRYHRRLVASRNKVLREDDGRIPGWILEWIGHLHSLEDKSRPDYDRLHRMIQEAHLPGDHEE